MREDAQDAARLTVYAAEELSRWLPPEPRYTLLARYPEWQDLLADLYPPPENWQHRLLENAYRHSIGMGRAIDAALRYHADAVDDLLHSFR